MGRTLASRAVRRLAVLALVSLSWPAWSQTVTLSQFPPNPGVMPGGGWSWGSSSNFGDPPPPRAWVNGQYGGVPGAKLTVPSTVVGPAGPLTVQVGRVAPRAAIAVGAAALARALPAVAVGVAAWDMWNELRIRPDGNGGLDHDPGQDQQEYEGLAWTEPSYPQCGGKASPSAVTECVRAILAQNHAPHDNAYWSHSATVYSGPTMGVDVNGDPRASATIKVNHKCTNTASGYQPSQCGYGFSEDEYRNLNLLSYMDTVLECPASIGWDVSYPRGHPPGPDGKCYTGTYTKMTPEQAGAFKEAHKPFEDPAAAAEDVIQRGGEIQGEPGGITGPGQQTGTPTTTTTTTSTGTKTQTETKTYNYNYGDSTVTYNTTTTIVTINEDGTTTTTTTNTGTPPGETQDPEDPCVKNPGTLGCIKLGEAPSDAVPKVEKNIAFAAEDLGMAGSCPAPVSLPHGQQISYQTVCDGVLMARPLIIAMGFLMAAGVMLGGFKLE